MTRCHAGFVCLLGKQHRVLGETLDDAYKKGRRLTGPCHKKHGPGQGLSSLDDLVAMGQQLLLLVLLLTAAASTCITALAAAASPPLPEAFLAFLMWALASTALAVHLPRARRGGPE